MNDIRKIEIINSANESKYNDEIIRQLLAEERITASHGKEFIGRPVTEIIFNSHALVKLRMEYDFAEREARIFIKKAIEKEHELNVYHPEKTWFLVFEESDGEEKVHIANISPFLRSLDKSENILRNISPQNYIESISALLDMYLRLAKEHNVSLDLSLSNFALDEKQNLYYLDDEVYRWDDFAFLPHFLANLIRTQDWLNNEFIKYLGGQIRGLIKKYFDDIHWATVIAEGLRPMFVAKSKQGLQQALITALYSEAVFDYKPKSTAKIMALLADPHANVEALEICLNYLDKRGINDAIVLGDIVGYGPHPQECIDLLRAKENFSIIRGNHDHAVATGKKVSGSNSVAGWTLEWTQKKLDEQYKEWLISLPAYIKEDNWLAVHGSPKDKTFFNGYVYQMTYKENLQELENRNIPLCFHGHTHIQKIYYRENRQDLMTDEETNVIKSAQHSLICPGSIGQPRSGKTGVEFAIINTETLELEFHRLPYNIDKTLAAMKEFNFPPALGERLAQGK